MQQGITTYKKGCERDIMDFITIQYRHLIPAPVDQNSAGGWVYKHPLIT